MQVEVKGMTKCFKDITVLNDINMEMNSGTIYGIVGKNGSGKTMLFRCLAGLVKPTEGAIFFDGRVLHKELSMPPNMGVVIENMGLYPEFTGLANLKYLANIRKRVSEQEIKETIARVGLNPDDKRTLKKYSLGMRQRIILAQALMEKPDILLLDEPTNGLDDKGVELIRDILKEEAERGALIMLASHNKEDVLYLCDKVFYMVNGCLEERQ